MKLRRHLQLASKLSGHPLTNREKAKALLRWHKTKRAKNDKY